MHSGASRERTSDRVRRREEMDRKELLQREGCPRDQEPRLKHAICIWA